MKIITDKFMTIQFDSVLPIRELVDKGDFDNALGVIAKISSNLVSRSDFKHKFLYLPQLDELVQEIGENVYRSDITPISSEANDINIFVVSELYSVGGHTRLLEDMLAASTRKNVVVITDFFNRYSTGKLELGPIVEKISNATIIVLPKMNYYKKVLNLIRLFKNLAPKTLGILAHHQDVVAYSACNPLITSNQVLIHHADHNPSLGATIKNYTHFDVTLGNLEMCIHAGYVKPEYLTMSAPINFKEKYIKKSPLSTATSGTFNKFTMIGNLAYQKIVKSILQSTSGRHYHIGPIPDEQLKIIKNELFLSNIDPEKFIYIGPVFSLSKTLLDLDIDIYITSAPIGGAKAFIEALSCGLAILRFSIDDDIYQEKYFYPKDILAWSNINNLENLIKNINLSVEQEKSKLNFLTKHHPDIFTNKVRYYF